jgi:hypothetical protein
VTTGPAPPGHRAVASAIGQDVRRRVPWWLLALAVGVTVASLPAAQAGWAMELALVGLPVGLARPLTLLGQSLPWVLAVICWMASPWAVGPLGSANLEYSSHGGCGVAVLTWPVTRRSRRGYRLNLVLFAATLASSWYPALWADGLAIPVALAAAGAMAAVATIALHVAARHRFQRPTPR